MSCMYSQRPASRRCRAQQRDRRDPAGRPARIGLGQEDRAEPVRHPEMRVERRHEIEQRIQQVEVRGSPVLRVRRGACRRNTPPRASSRRRRPGCRKPSASARDAGPTEATSSDSAARTAPSRDRAPPARATDTASSSAMATYSHRFDGRRSPAAALMTASLEVAAAENRHRGGQQGGDVDDRVGQRVAARARMAIGMP